MSERIVDESFVDELEGDQKRRRSLDEQFARLEDLVEKKHAEVLASSKGRFRSALNRFLFRLLRPAVAPFIDHQKELERGKLQLMREMWYQADERLASAESRLLQLYIKVGESMAMLRNDLLMNLSAQFSESVGVVSGGARGVAEVGGQDVERKLADQMRRFASDLLSRTDLMLTNLEQGVAALQHDLERHTSLSGKQIRSLQREMGALLSRTEALQDRARLLTREIMSEPSEIDSTEFEPDGELLSPEEYAAHQERFRGSPELIARRQSLYVDYFRECEPVLDIGCGRGEFLELLSAEGIRAYGIDISKNAVAACREKGLEAECIDLFSHLQSIENESLGGIFAAQLVEHLDTRQLRAFLIQCCRALRVGGVLIAETLNPESVFALTRYFYQDSTHKAPLPPPLLQFYAELAGFSKVEIKLQTEVPEEERLQPLEPEFAAPAAIEAAVERLNANIERLNRFLYGYMEYAIVARK